MQVENEHREDGQGSRALVAASRADGRDFPASRPQAPFLTQLLACEHRLEPFRRHRRGAPEQAKSCYGAVAPLARPHTHLEKML